MLQLYKRIDNDLYYWITRDKDETTTIIHWGIVGERGKGKEFSIESFPDFREIVQKEIDEKRADGYEEFDEDEMIFLEVEYELEGFGSKNDLLKRHRLEDYLTELLSSAGLGYADGGGIGSGTMAASCIVIDFDLAKKMIEDNLKNTEFSDYSLIYRMDG